jgi:hypothetical protein
MRNTLCLACRRAAGATRLVGAIAACALALQLGAPIYLIASPAMSCCIKAHDQQKCPCRYCTHNRAAAPLLEQCGGDVAHPDPGVVGLNVFEAAAATHPAVALRPAPVPDAPPEGARDRVLEVPTPPG